MNRRAMFGLVHNCLIHPLCGLLWWVGDRIESRGLVDTAAKLHAWEPKRG